MLMYKRQVQNALDALRDGLVRFGANPFRIDLPRPAGVMKVGVDDFIVMHGKNAKTAFAELARIPLFLGEGISGDLLLEKEIKPIRWIIPNLIPEGLTVFAGKPKIGKSWLVLSLVVSVASGTQALEHYQTDKAEVLYLALEDSERRLKDRLKKIAPDFSGAKNAHFFCVWSSVEEKGLLALERWLVQHRACKAVFIDTLAKVRRASNTQNSYYEDYAAISALKQIADRFGIAVIVVHHVRKQISDDPFEMISGTNGISGSADTNLVLVRGRNDADASLHVSGRDVAEQELAMSFSDGVWKVLGNAAPVYASKIRQDIMLALVEADAPLGELPPEI